MRLSPCELRGRCTLSRLLLLPLLFSAASAPSVDDLPPLSLRVEPNPLSAATVQTEGTTLVLSLANDAFHASLPSPEADATTAVLGAFTALEPNAPAGFEAVVAAALRGNASALSISADRRQVQLRLPALPCFAPLHPEVVSVRLPSVVIASGRAVTAPPLRITASGSDAPPRWGSVRAPPREVWRNCTHVELRWRHPHFLGGAGALAGYRLEVRRRRVHAAEGATAADALLPEAADAEAATEPLSLGLAVDEGWNASVGPLFPPQPELAEASAILGPLSPSASVAYEVRVRAYAAARGSGGGGSGTSCAAVPGDDGAVLTLHAGWRADSLQVETGPSADMPVPVREPLPPVSSAQPPVTHGTAAGMRVGGPVAGGTPVRVRGACMHAVTTCRWLLDPTASPAAATPSATPPPVVTITAAVHAGATEEEEVLCQSPAASHAGMATLQLGSYEAAADSNATGGGGMGSGIGDGEAGVAFRPGAAWRSAWPLRFEYYALQVTRLRPASGPIAGGRELRISLVMTASVELQRLVRREHARCLFEVRALTQQGPTRVVASSLVVPLHASSAEVICATPRTDSAAVANVSVSLDGDNGTYIGAPPSSVYSYYDAALHAIFPSGGPAHGGTVVTIFGAGLSGGMHGGGGSGGGGGDSGVGSGRGADEATTSTLQCRFGGAAAGPVTPRTANDSVIVCVTPPTRRVALGGPPTTDSSVNVHSPFRLNSRMWHPSWRGLEAAEGYVTLSLNGEEQLAAAATLAAADAAADTIAADADAAAVEGALRWTYYAPPTVSSLHPADGPVAGGAPLTVRGAGFMHLARAGGAATARCRFGAYTTRVLAVRDASEILCEAPTDSSLREDAMRALSVPALLPQANRPAGGVGDDTAFALVHANAHCCGGQSAANRIIAAHPTEHRASCEALCVEHPSCRYFSYAITLSVCDLCIACHPDSGPPDASPPVASAVEAALNHPDDRAAALRSGGALSLYESYERVEPPLPRLLPFALALNGQQFSLDSVDRTVELGYLMYAAPLLNASVGGGPIDGGTLVTLSGRGFARAAARPTAARARYGSLWWQRHAALVPRCRFSAAESGKELGRTRPIELTDERIVCPVAEVRQMSFVCPMHGAASRGALLALSLPCCRRPVSMRHPPCAMRHGRTHLPCVLDPCPFSSCCRNESQVRSALQPEGEALPTSAGEPAPRRWRVSLTLALNDVHFEGVGMTSDPLNLTLHEQRISAIWPPGGPTSGGTVVRVIGVGLHSLAPHAAACLFGAERSDVRFLADGVADSRDAPLNCTAPPHVVQDGVPWRVALNFQPQPCAPAGDVVPPAFSVASLFAPTECPVSAPAEGRDGFHGSFRPLRGIPYDYYAPPVISSIVPTRGVHTGGVRLTVHGAGFRRVPQASHAAPVARSVDGGAGDDQASGDDDVSDGGTGIGTSISVSPSSDGAPLLCGFGLRGPTPAAPASATSVATLRSDSELICTSPVRLGGGRADTLSVALNGHDFDGASDESSAPKFSYIDPLLPNVTFPMSGPVTGGLAVSVLAVGLLNVSDGTLRCRFGAAEVPATFHSLRRVGIEGALTRGVYSAAVAAGHRAVLSCNAPPARDAGLAAVLRRHFDVVGGAGGAEADGTAAIDTLIGDATVGNRTLRLTVGRLGQRSSSGAVLFAHHASAPAAVVQQFVVSFEMLAEGTGRGDGVRFRYGPPQPASGADADAAVDASPMRTPSSALAEQLGSLWYTRGLHVEWRTEGVVWPTQHELRVSYDGVVLTRVALDGALRTTTWANVSVRYDDDGLEVMHNAERRVHYLPVYGYAPDATWQFSLSAHAGPHGDTHRVDNLRIRSGELVELDTAPLSISVNGQDFSAVPGGFRYYTPPVLSSASPATGPTNGGTDVVLRGFGFDAATQLECRFAGSAVVAAQLLNRSAARCTTPTDGRLEEALNLTGVSPPVEVPLDLSLNGVWEPAAALATLPWRTHAPPTVSGFEPTTGPLAGDTLVSVHGHGLAHGVHYLCRFGALNRTVDATYDTVEALLRCTAPPADASHATNLSVASAHAQELEVSINGQQFTTDRRLFTQHRSFTLAHLQPFRGESIPCPLHHPALTRPSHSPGAALAQP